MKLFLKLALFFCVLIIFEDNSLSLTDYQIKKICKKKIKASICLKNLLEKDQNCKKETLSRYPLDLIKVIRIYISNSDSKRLKAIL